ncbi:MAG: hypothetical protein ABIV25_13120 [Paracoccaceae bacterium]
MPISRNLLYFVIVVLAVIAAILGYRAYQERQTTSTIKIDVGKSGISIQTD